MNTSPRRAALAATVALGTLAVAASPAAAVDATTQVTFDVPTSISISAPATLDFGTLQPVGVVGRTYASRRVDVEVTSLIPYNLRGSLGGTRPTGITLTSGPHVEDFGSIQPPFGGTWSGYNVFTREHDPVVLSYGTSGLLGAETVPTATAGIQTWSTDLAIVGTPDAAPGHYAVPVIYSAVVI